MHAAPTTAQNVLPVIDDPSIRPVPWPTHTAPVRMSTTPTMRLAMVTNGDYAGARRSVRGDADR